MRVHAHRLGHQDARARRADAPDAVGATIIFTNSAMSLIDFLFSGVLTRFPELKLLYAEAQIGWIPYVLERVDDVWETHRGLERQPGPVPRAAVALLPPPGLQLLLQGRVGVELLDLVGVDNICSRPTTRTRTAPGRTRGRSPRSCSATSTPRRDPQDRARQRHRPLRPRPPAVSAYQIEKQAGSARRRSSPASTCAPSSTTAWWPTLRADLLEHLVICIRGQGELTPDGHVAFARRVGHDRPAPLRRAGRGPSGDDPDLRPQPAHRDLARRLHLRAHAAGHQPAARRG